MIKLEDVIIAIKDLGGKASLHEIYELISKKCSDLPTSWKDEIRGYIYHNSTDAGGYKEGNPNIFFRYGRGVWGVRHQEIIKGRSKVAIKEAAYTMLTVEEISNCNKSGNVDVSKFNELVEKKVSEVKRKYDMF